MTEEETKKQIVLDVLQAIKAKTEDSKNFKNAGDLKLREFSDKIDLVRIGNALKDDNDNSVPIETLFHKAGILAFLFNATKFLEEGSEYNFSSNLKVSTFGKDIQPFDDFKEKKDMTRSELEKKAIQYDVALLSAYQPEVDRITGGAVQDGTGTSYRLGELDEEDYEFIKLPNDEKKTVLDSLKKRLYKIILKSYPNFSGNKLKDTKTMPVWNSLTEEEEAICDFLEKGDFDSFRSNVMKKYSENMDFNEFLMKFGEVWKSNQKNYVEELFSNEKFDKKDKEYIRDTKSGGGMHENLLTSKHSEYILGKCYEKKYENKKWGNDGTILALLLKKLVQCTKKIEVAVEEVKDGAGVEYHKFTHDDMCGNSESAKATMKKYYANKDAENDERADIKKYLKLSSKKSGNETEMKVLRDKIPDIETKAKKFAVWHEGKRLLCGTGVFHTKLRNAINESKTVGEAVFNVRMVFEDKNISLTEDCKKDFYRVLNEVLKTDKKEQNTK
ncbi:MAG: hypothetical protein IJ673_05605 [Treponema sp.]|nr:hypothetical protein [Treponema sp.]